MNNFDFETANSSLGAISAVEASPYAADASGMSKFIAGGTNLLDLMKVNVARPQRLIDINGIHLDEIAETTDGALILGALAKNSITAYHPLVKKNYPILSAAILSGASPQIRNMASNGGNLLQRTRCYYFYDVATPCNKRLPGSGCSAREGLSRIHAVLGASDHCIATHPSDMCVALAALKGIVHVRSSNAERCIPFSEFHRLPGESPDLDTTLATDELITNIELPPSTQFRNHSAYIKIRDRASYAFALVSVAAMLDLDETGQIREARIALGGVAHKPWRREEAEAILIDTEPTESNFLKAADSLLDGARSYGMHGTNGFKIPMAKRAIVRALQIATSGTPNHAHEESV